MRSERPNRDRMATKSAEMRCDEAVLLVRNSGLRVGGTEEVGGGGIHLVEPRTSTRVLIIVTHHKSHFLAVLREVKERAFLLCEHREDIPWHQHVERLDGISRSKGELVLPCRICSRSKCRLRLPYRW